MIDGHRSCSEWHALSCRVMCRPSVRYRTSVEGSGQTTVEFAMGVLVRRPIRATTIRLVPRLVSGGRSKRTGVGSRVTKRILAGELVMYVFFFQICVHVHSLTWPYGTSQIVSKLKSELVTWTEYGVDSEIPFSSYGGTGM